MKEFYSAFPLFLSLSLSLSLSIFYMYWVVRKVRAAKDLNLINEIKNLNLQFFFKIGTNFPDNQIYKLSN